MKIIKDKQLVDNNWHYIGDDIAIGADNVTVSLARWTTDRAQLYNHSGKLGVRISPADLIAGFADDLARIELVELHFPDLADGRLFSSAWLLRKRYGYQGEIRATGHYMPEQAFYLSRVGVNAFAVRKQEDLSAIQHCLNDFSVTYQQYIN